MSSERSAPTVLYLTHNYPRYPGDFAGAFVARLCELTVQRGVRAVVVAPHAPTVPERDTVNGVEVRRFRYASDADEVIAYRGELGKIALWGPQSIWAYNRFLRAFTKAARSAVADCKPDVIHAHWWIPGGLIARRLPTSVRTVLTMHGTDVRMLARMPWIRPLARRVFLGSDALTVVSSSLAAIVTSVDPGADAKLSVLPMPPNDDAFIAGGTGEAKQAVPRILCVTRFIEQKRNAILLRSVKPLLDDGVALRLKFIGEGPLLDRLAALIHELAIEAHVEIGPPVDQSTLAEEYRRADVVVLPSVNEGLGMVLVEAQMCGTAVVGAASGGILDIIDDGKTGLLAAPDDDESLAAALRSLVENSDLRRRLAEAGRESALARFSSNAIISRFLSLYGLNSNDGESATPHVPA